MAVVSYKSRMGIMRGIYTSSFRDISEWRLSAAILKYLASRKEKRLQKARDADALTAAFREYTAEEVKRALALIKSN